MKKFAKMLLMLACVFGLTACGSAETVSEYQQSKIENAQAHATFIIDNVTELVKNGTGAEWLEKYNNVELAEVFTSQLSEVFYNKTQKRYPFYAEGKGVRSALSSFESGLETIGTIKQEESTAVVDGDTIVVTVPVTGEKASGSVELIFTNDIYMKMTSCTLNLDETMGQLMTRAALNTLMGMGTVFAVLILICLIISAFGLIPKIQASFSKKKEEPVVAPSASATPAAAKTEEPEDLTDDLELVAVIAAAIAAYEGTSADGFQVRSIRRANTNKWKKA